MKLTASLLALSFLCASLMLAAPHGAARASQAVTAKEVPFKNVINGKDKPSFIADAVAYDVFFRALVSSPAESAAAQSRLRALAVQMGISDGEADAIRAAAEEFNQNVALFDAQAGDIKDKHLPNLTPGDVGQLTALQKQKESLIISTVASLPARLGRQLAGKLRLHITGYVKRRVRSLQPPTPDHNHHDAGLRGGGPPRFLKAGFAPAQTYNNFGMGAYGHLYVDGWQDTNAHVVYGQGLVTEDYNSYNHQWSVTTRVYNPEGTRSASQTIEWYRATPSSTTSLSVLDGEFGDFFIEIDIREKCPYIYGIIALGIFLLEPTESVPPSTAVGFDKAFLQGSNDPQGPESAAYASAVFDSPYNNANLNINTTQGPAACGGESFVIQASFVPPPNSASCCSLTHIGFSKDAQYEKSPNPVSGFVEGIFTDVGSRNPYVAVRLRKRLTANGTPLGTTNSVFITIHGTFGNGQTYAGHATVKPVCQ